LSGRSATHGVGVQFAVGEIAGPVRRESSYGRKNRRDTPSPSDPGESECVVAIQLSVVHPRGLGSNRRSKNRRETHDQQSIQFSHNFSSTCWLSGWLGPFPLQTEKLMNDVPDFNHCEIPLHGMFYVDSGYWRLSFTSS
jgi:hypothetical protein